MSHAKEEQAFFKSTNPGANSIAVKVAIREISMPTRASINFILLMLFTVVPVAHGAAERITGTVERISSGSITIETTGNVPATVKILLIPSTKFLKNGQDTFLKELEVGVRVVVQTKSNAGGLDALSIAFGKQPSPGDSDRFRLRHAPGSVTA